MNRPLWRSAGGAVGSINSSRADRLARATRHAANTRIHELRTETSQCVDESRRLVRAGFATDYELDEGELNRLVAGGLAHHATAAKLLARLHNFAHDPRPKLTILQHDFTALANAVKAAELQTELLSILALRNPPDPLLDHAAGLLFLEQRDR